MHTLRAVAIEGAGVVATDDVGTRFHVEIDDNLRSRLRETSVPTPAARKLPPREIQAHIRAGMSAAEVAALTGAPIEYIQRYEGPVLAERQYVVESALGVPVPAIDADPEAEAEVPTFGTIIGERLEQLSADEPEWSSWKEPGGGWVLRLAFTADDIDHDARWRFDPKKLTLAPLSGEAVALSQQGEIGSTLMPRLRAVPSDAARNVARFDSAAFELPEDLTHEGAEVADPSAAEEPAAPEETQPHHEPIAYGRGRVIEPRTGAISVVPGTSKAELGETADLLEALRRRRGEREAAGTGETAAEPSNSAPAAVRVLERPSDRKGEHVATAAPRPTGERSSTPSSETVPVRPARRGRTSMPTWDEIVFGARPDDEG